MNRRNKLFAIVFGIALALSLFPRHDRADDYDKKTIFTFSGPVQVANTNLPAGTYVFKLADNPNRDIVQIYNEDQSRLVTQILANPDYRLEPTGQTVVKFSETAEGNSNEGTLSSSGLPLKEWFFAGDEWGVEFPVKPQLAAAQQTTPVPENPPAASAAPSEPAAPVSNAPTETASAQAAPQPEPPAQEAPKEAAPETSAPAAEISNPTAEKELPKTASPMPLIGLIGLIALGAGISLRILAKQLA